MSVTTRAPLLALLLASACIRPPEIVLVDRATALEQQAAGSFNELEEKLVRATTAPRPVRLSPEELEALGIRSGPIVDNADLTDADRIDALLKQHCIGEGHDGTLVDTRESCKGASDHALALTLIERVNRARLQLWRWLHDRRPEAPVDEVRRAWRDNHRRGVVCGGWLQNKDGTWEAKKC